MHKPQFAAFTCPNCRQDVNVECKFEVRRTIAVCQCGQRSAVTVPARDFDPSAPLITPRTTFDPDGKLDTGMTAKEAVQRAEHWWDTVGAKEMKMHKLRHTQTPGGSLNGIGSAFISSDPDDPNFLPSGIAAGRPWLTLTKNEKARVVKAWHHFYIRLPDTTDTPKDETYKLTGKTIN